MESQAGTVPFQRCPPHFLIKDRDGAGPEGRSCNYFSKKRTIFPRLVMANLIKRPEKPKELALTKTITIVQSKHETRVCFTFLPFLQGI